MPDYAGLMQLMVQCAGGAGATDERRAPPLDWEEQPPASAALGGAGPGHGQPMGAGQGQGYPQGQFAGGYAQAVMGGGGGGGVGGMVMAQRSASMGGYHGGGGGGMEPLPLPPRPHQGMAPGQPGVWGGGGGYGQTVSGAGSGGGGGGGVRPPHPPPQYNNGGGGGGKIAGINNSNNSSNNGRAPAATLVSGVHDHPDLVPREVMTEIRRLGEQFGVDQLLTIFAGCAAAVVEGHDVGSDPAAGDLVESCLGDFQSVLDEARTRLRGKRLKRQ
jgi:hypothetical protein